MKHLITFFVILFFSSSAYSQTKKSFISKDKTLEVGVGAGLFSTEVPNFYRLQVVSRDLILNRFGFYYTFEYIDNENGDYLDLLGLTYRLNKNFSVQAATGFTKGSLLETESFRKEIALAYHPQQIPFTFTTGYSITHGPTLTVNFKLFRSKKKKSKDIKVEVVKAEEPTKPIVVEKTIVSPPAPKVQPTEKVEATSQVVKENETKTQSTPVVKPTEDVKKVPQLPKSPKVDYEKLCDDNELSTKYNSAELSEIDKAKLSNFVNFLKSNKKYKLQITGRADKIGSDEYNLALGQRRADNAKKYLESKGVNSNQLISISIGESQSQNANTPEERAAARTTIFKLVTP